jgi:hypothetical protein
MIRPKHIWIRDRLNSFFSQSFPLLPTHSRCRGCLFSLDHTHLHTPQSVGLLWTRDRPVAETSTWQHKHSQETTILRARFEPEIPASAWPQTYALDRAATSSIEFIGAHILLIPIIVQEPALYNFISTPHMHHTVIVSRSKRKADPSSVSKFCITLSERVRALIKDSWRYPQTAIGRVQWERRDVKRRGKGERRKEKHDKRT